MYSAPVMTRQSKPSSCYYFGVFRLTDPPLRLWREGDRIDLPTQPLRLLRLLVSRAGNVVSHNDICDELWSGRTVAFSGSVHVAIRQIRSALQDTADDPVYIETVPRIGYRFIAPVRQHRHNRTGMAATFAGVAATVMVALGLPSLLSSPDEAPLPEAVRLGEHLLAQALPEDAVRSRDYFDAALAGNPQSLRALTGAARAALLSRDLDAAAGYTARALTLDARSAEAIEIDGHVRLLRDRDLPAASAAFEQALDINPELASAHHGLASVHLLSGEFERAINEMQIAREIDPASTLIQADMGWIAYFAGRYDTAIETCESAVDLHPELVTFRYCILRAAAAGGDPDTAFAHIDWLMRQSDETPAVINQVLQSAEPVRAFEAWRYARYTAADRETPVPPALVLAASAAGAGHYQAAAEWLSQASDNGDPNLPFAILDPVFMPVTCNPEFADLMARIALASDHFHEITDRLGLPVTPLR